MNPRISAFVCGLGHALLILYPSAAAESKPVVGKHVTAHGMLLRQEAPGKPFQVLKQGMEVAEGDLLVALPGAAIESKNGAVRLSLLSDLDGTSVFPVLESAIRLHAPGEADLDFILDRGRVDVTHRKDKGTARVKVRFRKEVWELDLIEPGTRVGLEIYGRWPRGVFFHKDDQPPKEPTAELVLIVIKGAVELKAGTRQLALHAPPGPAFFHWESIAGAAQAPEQLQKLPPWAEAETATTPQGKEALARLEKLRQRLEKDPPQAILDELLKSMNPGERRQAVIALGAIDNLSGLISALSNETHPDVREHAIMVLRHWIGRGPGQDLKLYNWLIEEKKYSPTHADLILRLLHSFGEVDLGLPETYEALIAYLNHEQLPIRELARWQLYRLVPAGKDIPYDAAAPAKDRQTAQAAWKKLIPEGQLPPKKRE